MERFKASKPAIAIAALAIAGLTGCSSAGSDGASEPPDTTGGEVTFMYPQGTYAAGAFDTFEADNPDIELTVEEVPAASYKQQIRTLTQTGDLPDVLQLPGGPDGEALVLADATMNLAEALNGTVYGGDEIWRDSFREGVLEEASQTFLRPDEFAGGEQWFVPQSLASIAAVYNQDIFDEIGISAPTSWDEFVSNNEALVDAGYIPMTYVGAIAPDWWPKMIWDQTARDVTRTDLESGDVDFTDAGIQEGFEVLADLFAAGTFPESAFSDGTEEAQALFLSGRAAQFVHVVSLGKYVDENAPFEVGAFALPGALDIDPVRPVGGATSNVVVSRGTENAGASIELVKYLTSADFYETQVANFMLSPLAETPSSDNEIYTVFSDAVSGGAAVPQTWFQSFDPANYDKLNKEIYPAVSRGEITPLEAGEQINELFQK